MHDEIYDAGCQAYIDGKGEDNCPYVDSYTRTNDYWECEAGRRQRWLNGFRDTGIRNELMSKHGEMQASYWPPSW